MRTCAIYVLIDPLSKLVRYVGKTVRPHKRLFDHIQDAKNKKRGRLDHRSAWIRSLLAKGVTPRFLVMEQCPVCDWADRERFWILTMKQLGCDLVNANAGGVGCTQFSDAHRAKLSSALAARNRARTGWKYTPEQRARLSTQRTQKNSSLTKEQKRDMAMRMILKRKPGWNSEAAKRRAIQDDFTSIKCKQLRYYYRNKQRKAKANENTL